MGEVSLYFKSAGFRACYHERRFGTEEVTIRSGALPIPTSDLGLFRNFSVTERIKLQIRAEGINISNTPHFANPGANVSNMTLNPDGSVKSLGGFGQIASTNPLGRLLDQRYFRFGLRFMF